MSEKEDLSEVCAGLNQLQNKADMAGANINVFDIAAEGAGITEKEGDRLEFLCKQQEFSEIVDELRAGT